MFQFGHLELSCKMKVPQVQDEKFEAENSTRQTVCASDAGFALVNAECTL